MIVTKTLKQWIFLTRFTIWGQIFVLDQNYFSGLNVDDVEWRLNFMQEKQGKNIKLERT